MIECDTLLKMYFINKLISMMGRKISESGDLDSYTVSQMLL
jgi:hypothetical protein